MKTKTHQNSLVDVAKVHVLAESAGKVQFRNSWDEIKHQMVIYLIFSIGFESVEIADCDEILKCIFVHKVILAIVVDVFLLCVMQDFKREADIQFSKLKSKQSCESSLEVTHIMLQMQSFSLVLKST